MAIPLISIIIPTYNSALTLPKCLESVFEQTFKTYEIIIVDGLSSDGTVSIIKQSDHSNIRWVSEKDAGIYDAMNKGIRLARGEWLYFLGSDDHFYSKYILEKIFHRSNLTYDVIYGNVISPQFNGLYDGIFTVEKLFNKNICHQAIFFKKEVFKEIGLFNLKYKAFSDWDHNLKWFISTKIKKKYLNEVIAFYAEGGFSSQNNDSLFLNIKQWEFIKYFKKRRTLLNNLRMAKAEITNALKENRRRDALRIAIETPYLFF